MKKIAILSFGMKFDRNSLIRILTASFLILLFIKFHYFPSCSDKNKRAENFRVECFPSENREIVANIFPPGTPKGYIEDILLDNAYFEYSGNINSKDIYVRYGPFRYSSFRILVIFVDGKSDQLWYGGDKLY